MDEKIQDELDMDDIPLYHIELAAEHKLRYALKMGNFAEELVEQLTSSLRWLYHYSEKYNISLPEKDKINALLDKYLEVHQKMISHTQKTKI